MEAIIAKEQLSIKVWESYLKLISLQHKDELTVLESNIGKNQVQVLANQLPLKRIAYNSLGNSKLSIIIGKDQDEIIHVINSPIDIWLEYDSRCRIKSIEILNKNLDVSVLSFLL